MDDNTATTKESVPVSPAGYMRSERHLGQVVPVPAALAELAAGENREGEIHDVAQAAVEYIHFLEQDRLEYVRELSRLQAVREADFRKDMPAWTTVGSVDGDKPLLAALLEIYYDTKQSNDAREIAFLAQRYIRYLHYRTFDYLEGQLHYYTIRWVEEYRKRLEAQQGTADIREGLARDEGVRVAEKLLNYSRAYGQMRRKIELLKATVGYKDSCLEQKTRAMQALKDRVSSLEAKVAESGQHG